MKINSLKKTRNFARSCRDMILRYNSKLYEIIFLLPFLHKPLPRKAFGKSTKANKDFYLKLHKNTIKSNNKKLELFEEELNYAINIDWFNEVSLITQTCIKNSVLNFNHGRVLYSLICKYIEKNIKNENKNLTILETGTARGFSALCLSKAINDQKVNGKIITIDCIPHNVKMFWNCIKDFEGENTRQELLSKWQDELNNIVFVQGWTIETLQRIGLNRINFAFLDAQHTKKSVLEEFEFIHKRQKNGDMILFDDVTPTMFPGVCEAVKEIELKYPYKIEKLNFDKSRGYAVAIRE